MLFNRSGSLSLTGLLALSSTARTVSTTNIITKDVVIVGGGAAGAYAAAILREDYNKSISLIEKDIVLGGAVDSWVDGKTGKLYELGVEVFLDYAKAKDFFARFNVSVETPQSSAVNYEYADFETGLKVNYTAPTSNEQYSALEKYAQLAEEYEDIMLPGLWNFPTADKFPEDLLLNFGDFAKKYGIEAAVPIIWDLALTYLALAARALIGQGQYLTPTSGRNQDIYDKVAELLGDDVLYSSVVVNSNRSSEGVTIVAKGEDGCLTEIHAKRLLVAIPPTVSNLAPLHLDDHEFNVLSQMNHTTVYSGGVDTSNIPLNTSISNVAPSGDWLDYPDFSFLQWFKNLNSTEGYHKAMVFGTEDLTISGAKEVVEHSYQKLIDAGSLPADNGDGLDWLRWEGYGSMHLRVSAENLKSGFIQDFYSLQGRTSTWYAGAAWSVQLHTPVWAFSESVVARLVEGLQ